MNPAEGTSGPDRTDLRERLARLTPAEREQLAKRLAKGGSQAESKAGPELVSGLPRAAPVRVEAEPSASQPDRTVSIFPASPGQMQMWYHYRLEPDSPVYNSPMAFRLRGRVDLPQLEAAFRGIIQRHATLRTTFAFEDGQLWQRVASTGEFVLDQVEWKNEVPGSDPLLAEHINHLARRPFDLTIEPQLRATIVCLGNDEHLLLIVLHHINSDGWSRSNLARELSDFYTALSSGASASVQSLPVQFTDVAASKARVQEHPRFAEQVKYWQTKLAGELPVLRWGQSKARPKVPTFRGDSCDLPLEPKLWSALRELAQREGVTLFHVLLAAFKTLLFRVSGEGDLRVGVPVANRHRVEVEGLIGFFINTLVLRSSLAGGLEFRELLQQVKAVSFEALAHSDVPFEQLVELAKESHAGRRIPLIQTLFALQDFPPLTLTLPGVEVTPWPVSTGTAKVDLSIAVERAGDGWTARSEFSIDLFERQRVQQLLNAWKTILETVTSEPQVRLEEISLPDDVAAQRPSHQELPAAETSHRPILKGAERVESLAQGEPELTTTSLLGPAERRRMLVDWNATGSDQNIAQCVHWLIDQQAVLRPDAIAVIHDGQSLTYRQLLDRAEQLARRLRPLVGPDSLVGLFVQRSTEMIVGVLAILKAGAAYLPLDPEYPAERIAFIVTDAQPKAILTVQGATAQLPPVQVPTICIDAAPANDWPDPELPLRQGTPEQLAYVIYTSGSTGRPKGVLIEHRSLVNYTLFTIRRCQLGPGDRILQFASLAFDASAEEIFACLARGATLVLRTDDMISRTSKFLSCCAAWNVTVWHLPTAYWHHLVAEMEAENLQPPPTLRMALIGGERALPEMLDLWQKRVSTRVPLLNTYGPTETTVASTWHDLTCEPALAGEPLPIGQPIANTSCYVLDSQLQPVPVGVAGELFIGGSGLARGYLNRPELTAERFIPNPFVPDSRVYRTGDKVRYRPDGVLEYLGRFDDQVKVRGYRIELGEVEAALSAHPDLQAAVVIARQDDRKNTTLAAVIVPRPQRALPVTALRDWLAARLPDYMVPSAFAQLERLPVTPNGKIDRKALAQSTRFTSAIEGSGVPPRTELERQLAGIWEAALRRSPVGVQDDFFDLGGHSLLAIVINSRITQQLKVEVPLRWILENPTIESLAQKIESAGTQAAASAGIGRADRTLPLPMSFGQQQMWLIQEALTERSVYNVPVVCRLRGKVDRDRLRAALSALAQRHEVLRTALVQRNGQLLQEIAPGTLPLPWSEQDLSDSAGNERESVLQRALLEAARRPFDLDVAPLWRALWITCAPEDHLLAFTFHHCVLDEWSLRLFYEELSRTYALLSENPNAALQPLPVQYADYAVWQARQFVPERLQPQFDFWKTQLQALPPPLELPADSQRPAGPTWRGATHHFWLEADLIGRLRDMAREENTTLFAVLLASFQVWLYRYTGQPDLITGIPVTRRERPELHPLIGYFLNTLPLRARLDGRQPFRRQLQVTRDSLTDGLGHADVPYHKLAEFNSTQNPTSRHGLFQVLFAYSEEPAPVLRLDRVDAQPVRCDTATSKSDLMLNIRVENARCECRLEYTTDLFAAGTAARMASHFVELCTSLAAAADTPIDELNLVPELEHHKLLAEWNPAPKPNPDACVHALVEAQAERAPDGAALLLEERVLTYGELNRRANEVAVRLKNLRVGPDVLVGLCIERSFEMIIGLLGILKAGGACVPLDPSLPGQRLAYLVGDAGCQAVVTQAALSARLTAELRGDSAAPNLVLLDAAEALPLADTSNPAVVNTPADLVYVLYTSGSTGQPKGVEMPHRSLANLIHWQASTSVARQGHRTLQFASLGFDVSFQEIFATLAGGGTLVLVSNDTRSDPEALLDLLCRAGVHRVYLPFVMFDRLAQAAADREMIPCHLREICVAGEQLRITPAIRRLFERLPDCQLWNHYGPTESHVVTAFVLQGPSATWPELPPIGRPIDNSRAYVLDSSRRLVPAGVPGELYVGGACLSRGYRRRPDLTDQRYFPDPFVNDTAARIYRTGDLCRWRDDGQLHYIGRSDHQVKIRGFRVELGEIETALSDLPEVKESVLVVRESDAGNKELIGYVVLKTGQSTDEAKIKAALRARLPRYMVPAWIELLSALPLTANGKVDHRALPAPKRLLAGGTRGPVFPRNRVELELVQIWQRLFERNDIGCEDNFFDLGGHSLLAARLAAEIRATFGSSVTVATLFQSPTVAALAQRLSDAKWAPKWISLVPLQPLGSKPPLIIPHGWGGDVFSFLRLNKQLGTDQPLYALQAVGLDGKTPRHTSIEQMAAHYVDEVRAFQPGGPYYLAGYSMGGLIAFEMAQQLCRLGEPVAFLGLLDTFPKAAPWMVYARTLAPYLKRRWSFHLERWRAASGADKLRYVAKSWEGLAWWIGKNRTPTAPSAPAPASPSSNITPTGSEDYFWSIAARYRLQRYPGAIDLFLSENANPVLYPLWGNLAQGGVTLHPLAGTHLQIMFSPEHLPNLAAALKAALERARQAQLAPKPSD